MCTIFASHASHSHFQQEGATSDHVGATCNSARETFTGFLPSLTCNQLDQKFRFFTVSASIIIVKQSIPEDEEQHHFYSLSYTPGCSNRSDCICVGIVDAARFGGCSD
jgi:hypothetical protein